MCLLMCIYLSIYPSGFITAVAVFRKPNAIPLCFSTDLFLNFLLSWLLVLLPSTFFLDVLFFFPPLVHSIINFGILSSGILLTWPYHCSLFFSMMSGFPFILIISFICFLCVNTKILYFICPSYIKAKFTVSKGISSLRNKIKKICCSLKTTCNSDPNALSFTYISWYYFKLFGIFRNNKDACLPVLLKTNCTAKFVNTHSSFSHICVVVSHDMERNILVLVHKE